MQLRRRKPLSSAQIILIGFSLVILAGTLLLMLPFASEQSGSASFRDALFTATSATCVTGLIVQDTATYWTMFGKLVILVLIQIGGMGVVTIAALIAVISGKKIGLVQRNIMQDSISAHNLGGIVKLTNYIVKVTLCVEGIGALFMMPAFCRDFGFGKGIWYAVFHSISAFCNGGFDLMGEREKFSSMTTYSDDPMILIPLMLLIIIGGLGFLTWDDIRQNRFCFRLYSMQTKVILVTYAALIVFPAIYFWFTMKGLSGSERVLGALFQSVAPRTAGFNSVDLSAMSDPEKFVMIFLMLIGGAPGSTAGGMKVTTFAVLCASMLAVIRRQKDTTFFDRRLEDGVVRNAAALLVIYFILFSVSGCVISTIEQLPLLTCMFETVSAIATVGLTLGVTPTLSTASHIILMVLMFIGRIGGLTFIFAAIPNGTNKSRKPRGKIAVG
jgi:trk system potassium uptake protein TrkH